MSFERTRQLIAAPNYDADCLCWVNERMLKEGNAESQAYNILGALSIAFGRDIRSNLDPVVMKLTSLIPQTDWPYAVGRLLHWSRANSQQHTIDLIDRAMT